MSLRTGLPGQVVVAEHLAQRGVGLRDGRVVDADERHADGGVLEGGLKALLGGLQRGLRAALDRDVARDADGAGHPPEVVADRGERARDRDLAAVTAPARRLAPHDLAAHDAGRQGPVPARAGDEVGGDLTERLALGEPVERGGGVVPGRDAALAVDGHDRVRAVLHQRRVTGPHGLDAGTVGDVAGDHRHADHLPARVTQRRHADRDRDGRAVAAHPLGLEVLDRPAAEHAPPQVRRLAVAPGRDYAFDRAADCFPGLPSVKSLRTRVPRGDAAAPVGREDRVRRVLDEGSEALGGG